MTNSLRHRGVLFRQNDDIRLHLSCEERSLNDNQKNHFFLTEAGKKHPKCEVRRPLHPAGRPSSSLLRGVKYCSIYQAVITRHLNILLYKVIKSWPIWHLWIFMTIIVAADNLWLVSLLPLWDFDRVPQEIELKYYHLPRYETLLWELKIFITHTKKPYRGLHWSWFI